MISAAAFGIIETQDMAFAVFGFMAAVAKTLVF